MSLKINKSELLNSLGFMTMFMTKIQALLSEPNPNVNEVRGEIQKIIKMLNTIASKEQLTKTSTKFSEQNLKDMRIK